MSYAKGNYAPKVLFTISVKKSGNTFFSPQFFAVFVVVVIVCLFVVFVLFLFRSFCLYGWLVGWFFALLLLLFYMHMYFFLFFFLLLL